MSMPVATYKCTACDFSRWDAITWGYRYYLYGRIKVPMKVSPGWCQACNDLVAVEVLPTATREAELLKQFNAIEDQLNESYIYFPLRKRWWQCHARKTQQQLELESEIESGKARLAEYRLRRAALSTRTSLARCLRCSFENCAPLPSHEADYFDMASAPAPIGFTHPGCGGELLAICDGTRLSLVMTETAYDIEGRRLAQH